LIPREIRLSSWMSSASTKTTPSHFPKAGNALLTPLIRRIFLRESVNRPDSQYTRMQAFVNFSKGVMGLFYLMVCSLTSKLGCSNGSGPGIGVSGRAPAGTP